MIMKKLWSIHSLTSSGQGILVGFVSCQLKPIFQNWFLLLRSMEWKGEQWWSSKPENKWGIINIKAAMRKLKHHFLIVLWPLCSGTCPHFHSTQLKYHTLADSVWMVHFLLFVVTSAVHVCRSSPTPNQIHPQTCSSAWVHGRQGLRQPCSLVAMVLTPCTLLVAGGVLPGLRPEMLQTQQHTKVESLFQTHDTHAWV